MSACLYMISILEKIRKECFSFDSVFIIFSWCCFTFEWSQVVCYCRISCYDRDFLVIVAVLEKPSVYFQCSIYQYERIDWSHSWIWSSILWFLKAFNETTIIKFIKIRRSHSNCVLIPFDSIWSFIEPAVMLLVG